MPVTNAPTRKGRHNRIAWNSRGTLLVTPTAIVLDDFNTGANQAVSTRAGWSTGHYLAPHVDFRTDAVPTYAGVLPTPNVASSNFWGTIQTPNQEAMLTVQSSGGNHWLFCRADTASASAINNGYRCYFGFDGNLTLAKTVAGASTSLLVIPAGTSVPNPAAGDTYVLQVLNLGSTAYLNAYRRKGGFTTWDMLGSVTDGSVLAAGYIGMGTDGFSDPLIDSFGGISLDPLPAASNANTYIHVVRMTRSGA